MRVLAKVPGALNRWSVYKARFSAASQVFKMHSALTLITNLCAAGWRVRAPKAKVQRSQAVPSTVLQNSVATLQESDFCTVLAHPEWYVNICL